MANNFEEKAIESLSALVNVIGEDNVKDVQKKIADLIVERVRQDIEGYDMYLFYPEDYADTIDVAFEKVQKKITKMYSDGMLEVAQSAVEKFKESTVQNAAGIKEMVLDNNEDCGAAKDFGGQKQLHTVTFG